MIKSVLRLCRVVLECVIESVIYSCVSCVIIVSSCRPVIVGVVSVRVGVR